MPNPPYMCIVGLLCAAIFGLPAIAQENECGVAAAGASWMGGAAATSDIAVADAPLTLTGQTSPAGGQTTHLFSLSRAMEIRVEAAPQNDGDTVLTLYNGAGDLIVTDDDSGGDLAARAELSLGPGVYCLVVRGFANQPVTADIQVSHLNMAALTVGLAGGFTGTEGMPPFVGVQPCVAATPAIPIVQGGAIIDDTLQTPVTATNTVTDAPYYRFILTAQRPVSIRAENPGADPYIYLFDADGNLIAENDDYNSLNSRIDISDPPLTAGTYCVGMRALSNPDVPVTLTIRAFDTAAATAELYAQADAAPIDGGYPVTDIGPLPSTFTRNLDVRGDRAVFLAFTVTEQRELLINADEVKDSDPWIRLFDEQGNLVAENDDANGTLNSQIAQRLNQGRYYLGVRQYSTAYDGTIRISIQKFISTP